MFTPGDQSSGSYQLLGACWTEIFISNCIKVVFFVNITTLLTLLAEAYGLLILSNAENNVS